MRSEASSLRLPIQCEADIVTARTLGKEMARDMGFGTVDQTRIATGISELTRNILQYARQGRLELRPVSAGPRRGMEILAEDDGPGIPNAKAILEGGVRSARGLGLGIPGTRRLMDEFELESRDGQGTSIRCIKWL